MAEILYDDEFVQLTEEQLIIKRYFFPMLKPKVVRVRDIRVLYFDEQNNGKYTVRRTWGKSHSSDVYWAVDFRRCLPGDKKDKHDIIIDIEDGLKKGFSCQDAQTFLQNLRMVSPISLIVVDNLDV